MIIRINKNVILLSLAQALLMSVNTLLLTSVAIIGYGLTEHKILATLPLAIAFFSTLLTTIPASMIMSRYGRKNGFILSSLIGIIGSFLALIAVTQQSFILLSIAMIFFGIYTGFGNFFRFVAPEVVSPDQRNTAISYVLAGGVIAAVIGPNLANHSKDIFETAYFGSFVAVLILYILNLINILMMDLPKAINETLNQYARPVKEISRQPHFIVALLASTIGYSVMSLLMTATPLAMQHEHHQFSEVAFVIQWHVLAMFAPSFFTGHLINKFSAERIIFTGGLIILASIVINLLGTTVNYFWLALFLLGLGWNFMFIGGTTLLTSTYNESEKAKIQGFNDFIVYSLVTIASLSAGALQHQLGWATVNISAIPFVLLSLASIYWLKKQPISIQNT